MAGSYSLPEADIPEPVQARIEGLKFLAQHLDEPIVIFNPRMELVYANPAANEVGERCPLLLAEMSSFSQVPASPSSPCEPCPATELFQAEEAFAEITPSSDRAIDFPESCPLPRVVPLMGETGKSYFAVMMGTRGSDSVVAVSPDQEIPPHSFPQHQLPLRTIIGESEPIQQLVEMIRLIAASDATVLIQGESGTGKELVAKTIHAQSRRKAQPFVVVECSSLPETLLESELFGHVRGAFTGAVANRKGLFEEAEGGTIFLDEIADTTPAFQARLLRVLQEGEIKPVGSNQSIKVNVRVISAGNRSLEELVHAKQFRADLYYRLAVLPLRVPPLRERKEDILLLVKHFLDASIRQHRRSPLKIHPEAQRALERYHWPGNVRELENLLERAVVTCRTSMIQLSDIFGEEAATFSTNGDLPTVSRTARQAAERDRILQALSETKGDKTRAARLLKISRSSLYNKLRNYHISSFH